MLRDLCESADTVTASGVLRTQGWTTAIAPTSPGKEDKPERFAGSGLGVGPMATPQGCRQSLDERQWRDLVVVLTGASTWFLIRGSVGA